MNKEEKKLLKYFENSTKVDLNYERVANKLGIYSNLVESKSAFYMLKSLSFVATFGVLLLIVIITPIASIQAKDSTTTMNSVPQSLMIEQQSSDVTTQEIMQPPSASKPTIVFQGEKYSLEDEKSGTSIDYGYDIESPFCEYRGTVGNYKIYWFPSGQLIAGDEETKEIYEMKKISEN